MGLGGGNGHGRARSASVGTGSGPPRAPAGCRPMRPLYAQSHLTGRRSPCLTGRPEGGLGRQKEKGSCGVSWAKKPREAVGPPGSSRLASSLTLQHFLTSASSQPSAHQVRPPIYWEDMIQRFSQMGGEHAVPPLQRETPPGWGAGGGRFWAELAGVLNSSLGFQGPQPLAVQLKATRGRGGPELPGLALLRVPTPSGFSRLRTCARSLRVCCSPSPSSVSRAACSWSRRDS